MIKETHLIYNKHFISDSKSRHLYTSYLLKSLSDTSIGQRDYVPFWMVVPSLLFLGFNQAILNLKALLFEESSELNKLAFLNNKYNDPTPEIEKAKNHLKRVSDLFLTKEAEESGNYIMLLSRGGEIFSNQPVNQNRGLLEITEEELNTKEVAFLLNHLFTPNDFERIICWDLSEKKEAIKNVFNNNLKNYKEPEFPELEVPSKDKTRTRSLEAETYSETGSSMTEKELRSHIPQILLSNKFFRDNK